MTTQITPRIRRAVLTLQVVVTVLFVCLFGSTIYRDSELDDRGVEIAATVTGLGQTHGKCGLDCFTVAYSFDDASGRTFTGNYGIPSDAWDMLQEGGRVEIVYDPERPRRSEPFYSIPVERHDAEFRIVFLLVLMGGLRLALAADERKARREGEAPASGQ